jgi:hypothetical protein
MTTDATIQIIQMIQAQLSKENKSSWDTNNSLVSQSDSITSHVADYAQILGTAAGPLAQVAVANTLGQIAAANTGGAAAEAAAAEASVTATAGAAGIGALIVLILSFVLGALEASQESGSDLTQFLQQLGTQIQGIENGTIANWWGDNFKSIMSNWDNPAGSIGVDLDNLANEGTGGVDVKHGVSSFHDHAMAFVNFFIPSKTPGAAIFWERPAVPDQFFILASGSGWYQDPQVPWQNPFPVPPPGPPLGGSDQQMVLDPRSMLPFLLLGIQSYLTIESLINVIDPSQPTLGEFLAKFQGDLQEYASFLSSQYSLAVNGIVKKKIPTSDRLVDYISCTGPGPVSQQTFFNAWNGFCGVVDSCPPFGSYVPSPPVQILDYPTSMIYLSAPSYIIGAVRVSVDGGQSLTVPNFDAFNSIQANLKNDLTNNWIVPWIQDRSILKMMAWWKAIYLMNGYDKVWSIIQTLNVLANQPTNPPLTLDQDGTRASENWSARELCTILKQDGYILSGVQNKSLKTATGDYSLFSLVQCLDNIAYGGWGGPPSYSIGPPFVASPGPGPARPLGFRDRLAAAAFPQVPPQSGP